MHMEIHDIRNCKSGMAGHFRYSVWDPLLIITQMITMQCIFYSCLGFCIFLVNVISGDNHSLDQIYLYQEIHVKDIHGRCIIGSFLITSLFCSIGLWYFVQKTKQCLDFSTTIHLFHLIVCWIYNSSFPNSISWWLLNIVCVSITCVSGEFLCMRTEMKAIPLTLGPKADL
ncbi:sys1 golgi trafficking protein isoform X2 [Tachypleus tridentatus]|uniref:sys1 golgi trafficking protein isoform X2 n=1 Tax=Tachypleus tridentatus TaxID=6853 RepID=UPI003FD4BC07